MIGFLAVGTMMLIPMGIASYVFVVRGLRHTHLEALLKYYHHRLACFPMGQITETQEKRY